MSYTPLTQMVRRIKMRALNQGLYSAVYLRDGELVDEEVANVWTVDHESLVGLYDEDVTAARVKADAAAMEEVELC